MQVIMKRRAPCTSEQPGMRGFPGGDSLRFHSQFLNLKFPNDLLNFERVMQCNSWCTCLPKSAWSYLFIHWLTVQSTPVKIYCEIWLFDLTPFASNETFLIKMVVYSKLMFPIRLIFCLQLQFLGFETKKNPHTVAPLRKLMGTTLNCKLYRTSVEQIDWCDQVTLSNHPTIQF